MTNPLTRTALGGVVLVIVALAAVSAQPMVAASVSEDGDASVVDSVASADGGPSGAASWQFYHHRDDPAWPKAQRRSDGGPATTPPPAGTPSGYPWPPPAEPWPFNPHAPWSARHPPGGPPSVGVPLGAPNGDTPSSPSGNTPGDDTPGEDPLAGGPGGDPVATPSREPVAGGPGTPPLGLGDPVDDPSLAPSPTSPGAPPQALDRDGSASPGYRRSLLYSGLLGLILAIIGLTIVMRHRRHW
ncbi:hypothetical protein WEI85_03280 [Actinomycetes bacterium KLBMP 9797]